MSRSGYVDDESEHGQFAMWQGQLASSIRGKRGQKLLCDMLAALDAMPDKRLIPGHLITADGDVCALGALGRARGVDLSQFEKFIDQHGECDDTDSLCYGLAKAFDVAHQLIREIQYQNDEWLNFTYINGERHTFTPEERWAKMREWVVSKILPVAE